MIIVIRYSLRLDDFFVFSHLVAVRIYRQTGSAPVLFNIFLSAMGFFMVSLRILTKLFSHMGGSLHIPVTAPGWVPFVFSGSVLISLIHQARRGDFSLKRRLIPARVVWMVNIAAVVFFFGSLKIFDTSY